ncbi:hypothetical protein BESB_024450 [Besnoitia besnoiti]|uniref:Uncharacterized protein n=1 Tax=Besnoitia besnoiti TaxID=94643 RepID=A0A2A9M8E5_BESBE|nr:hypothetical protein BESB_024450 [Besnoitia besnoiti]PFH31953.1 hypothetical protein BESB_024450 [Besnoitia besnoiti]
MFFISRAAEPSGGKGPQEHFLRGQLVFQGSEVPKVSASVSTVLEALLRLALAAGRVTSHTSSPAVRRRSH